MATSPLAYPVGVEADEVDGPIDIDVDVVEGADGSALYDFNPQVAEGDPLEHDANLALHMSDSDLSSLGAELLEGVEDDKKSRGEWETTMADGMKLLGLSIEERTQPFAGACGVFDPLMAEAVIRWQAVARGELMPSAGPVKTQIIGIETPDLKAQASRVETFMNLYLTQLAPEYYEDMDQMLMWLPLVGSTFKKIYQDPVLGRPVAPFITPTNFIVAYGTADLTTAQRFCHVADLTPRQFRLLQMNGQYLDVSIGTPEKLLRINDDVLKDQVDTTQGVRETIDTPGTHEIYEVYADIDLKGFEHEQNLPCPYTVSIDHNSTKVLSVRRNWKDADQTYKRRKRFVHYKFLPGFGFYGIGYAHLLGNSAKAATTLTRQLIDAGTLNNFPGGLRAKGMRLEDNNIGIGPTEFREIDTGGLPLQSAVMVMPYKEPSQVLAQLRDGVTEGARNLANTAEIAVGEGRQDAPVGTTVALMEAATRVQSATMKRCHKSQGEELKMIADEFGENLPEQPYPFPVRGGNSAIMRSDFQSNVDVVPVSDPNITSSSQRMMRAQGFLSSATQAPEIHDMRSAYENLYTEMGMDPEMIAKILPDKKQEAKPLDPLSENQNALTGKPLKAAEYQDHDAHIAAHAPIAGDSPPLQAHINEHLAFKMRVQVQQQIGQPLPPMGQPMPPEVENQLALLVAQAMTVLAPQYKTQPAEDPYLASKKLELEQKERDSARDNATKIDVALINEKSQIAALTSEENIRALEMLSTAVENQVDRETQNERPAQ